MINTFLLPYEPKINFSEKEKPEFQSRNDSKPIVQNDFFEKMPSPQIKKNTGSYPLDSNPTNYRVESINIDKIIYSPFYKESNSHKYKLINKIYSITSYSPQKIKNINRLIDNVNNKNFEINNLSTQDYEFLFLIRGVDPFQAKEASRNIGKLIPIENRSLFLKNLFFKKELSHVPSFGKNHLLLLGHPNLEPNASTEILLLGSRALSPFLTNIELTNNIFLKYGSEFNTYHFINIIESNPPKNWNSGFEKLLSIKNKLNDKNEIFKIENFELGNLNQIDKYFHPNVSLHYINNYILPEHNEAVKNHFFQIKKSLPDNLLGYVDHVDLLEMEKSQTVTTYRNISDSKNKERYWVYRGNNKFKLVIEGPFLQHKRKIFEMIESIPDDLFAESHKIKFADHKGIDGFVYKISSKANKTNFILGQYIKASFFKSRVLMYKDLLDDPSQFWHVLIHELGHAKDRNNKTHKFDKKREQEFLNAFNLDKTFKGRDIPEELIYPSHYSKSKINEQIPEVIQLYMHCRKNNLNPLSYENRFMVLDKWFSEDK